MRILDRIVEQSGGDQAGRMGHIDHQQRADAVGDLAHALVVPLAAVSRSSADNHLGFVFQCELFHRIVVDPTGTLVELITHGMIENAGRIDRRAVRQMAAVRQIEPHERIAGLEHREKYGHIGLSARMRLHVGILGSVELAQAVDSQLLDPIDDLAAAVITRSGISFRIFVGQHRAHGLHDLFAYKILGGDQLDALHLPPLFALDQIE